MNLFTSRLTGKMMSTDAFEKTVAEMQARVRRWRQIEKSPELAEYLELKKLIDSSDFQETKHALATRKYKDTEEGRKMHTLERLSSTVRMKGYQLAVDSETFQAFLKFQQSEDFKKIHSMKERLKSSELRMFNMIYRSAFYTNYTKVLNSPELKQLNELKEEVATEDFQQRNALWADSKRWQHSDEYQKEQRYLELANSDDIKFFFKQREERIDWAELFRPAFDDDMSSSKNWKPGFGYANPAAKDGHSRTTELQAFNAGKNTFFADGRMDLEIHEESKKAVAWDEKKGFIEHVFDYTADVMNTKEAFSQESGMFVAKVRSQGTGHHFFGLTTGKPGSPMIALYHYNGKVHQLGLVNGAKTQMTDLTGMLRSMYYVYTFRWTKNELTWFVNDMEVLRLPNRLPKEPMFFVAESWLPGNEKGGEGKLKIQWARVYRGVEDSALAQRNAAEKAEAEAKAAPKAETKAAPKAKAEKK
ncbi:MAG: family 16 glycosylhydrolase [Paludibacteraceae bacterium]|nr:family 16 glycosylhydrolase [Paludibacteraceae bacterium]